MFKKREKRQNPQNTRCIKVKNRKKKKKITSINVAYLWKALMMTT